MGQVAVKEVLEENNWTVSALRDKRYNAVIHLQTAALGASEFYTLENNHARMEAPAEAIALDKRLSHAWVGHNRLVIIDNRPTGGFAQFSFADSHPAITWAVLDHERAPKLAHEALVAACRPVIVVADRPPAEVRPADALALDVHVVSDRRHDLSGRVVAELAWDGGSHRWTFEGDVPADTCVRVGTVQFEVPAAPGELALTLSGQVGDDAVDNRYVTTITPPPTPNSTK